MHASISAFSCCTALRASFAGAALAFSTIAVAATVVPGTSNPYLAGMPDGSTDTGDQAPEQSPVLVGGLTLIPGQQLTFVNAIGGTDRGGGCSLNPPYTGCDPVDGAEFFNHSGGDNNGISAVRAPISALMGVFLGPDQPNLTATPPELNFETLGLNLSSLSPQLKQLFFIGDGKTDANQVQLFIIPTGATRLYLGTMDGFGWFNNTGAITVDVAVVPEPSSLAFMLAGLAGVGWLTRCRTRPR